MCERKVVFDLEADGLLHDATRIHCVVSKVIGEREICVFVSSTDLEFVRAWARFSEYKSITCFTFAAMSDVVDNLLIGHNILGYDFAVMEKLLSLRWQDTNKVLDTLVLSRYLCSDRPRHSLAYWGEELAKKKRPIEDWKNQPIEDYIDRCIQDVEINELLYQHLSQNTLNLDDLTLAHNSYADMVKQAEDGAYFNQCEAKRLRAGIESEMERIKARTEPKLGSAPLSKAKQPKLPKKPFKKNGQISASGLRYGEKAGVQGSELVAILDNQEPVVLTKKIELSETAAIKQYLFTELGWCPTIWRTKNLLINTNKTERSKEEKREATSKYIREVWESPYRPFIWDILNTPPSLRGPLTTKANRRRAELHVRHLSREAPTTPQLQDAVSKIMCPNLQKLQGGLAEDILRWMALRNRLGILTGWISHSRLERDSRLPAESSGLTNTHRQRHKTVANVPKNDSSVVYGKEMRKLFIAPLGMVCVGCDLSGIEARLAGHYASEFDDGLYLKEVMEGDIHAKNAAVYSAVIEREVSRNEGKAPTFAIIYGVGVKKMSRMLNIPMPKASRLISEFWDSNPGLREAKAQVSMDWLKHDRQFISTLGDRLVPTRSAHSLLNCLIQSSGAVLFDRWWQIAKEALAPRCYQRWGVFHDEMQLYALPEEAEEVGTILVESAKKAGEYYNLKCETAAEYSVGGNWAETH